MLWVGLIKNHGFVDGNKRTATMAMQRWLDREGFALNVADEELVALAVAIANDNAAPHDVASWLEASSRPIGPP